MSEARPRPGELSRGGIPQGSRPVNRTPRVPPNGQPVRPRPDDDERRQALMREAARRDPDAVQAVEDRTPVDAHGDIRDSRYERVDLPSGFIFYEWEDISMRLVEPTDHAKITRGSRRRNLSVMLDVMSSLCDRDARQFAVSDWNAACQWQKSNSYPQASTTITWRSRYGNEASSKVRRTELKVTRLNKTRADYLEWVERGMAMPTMADVEVLGNLQDEDLATMFERAQFINIEPLRDRVAELKRRGDPTPTVRARVEELNKRGMSFYAEVDEFANEFANFGVTEQATVSDTGWNPADAVKYLRDVYQPRDGRPAPPEAAEYLEEADAIERMLDANEVPEPRKEVKSLEFFLWTMFPYV